MRPQLTTLNDGISQYNRLIEYHKNLLSNTDLSQIEKSVINSMLIDIVNQKINFENLIKIRLDEEKQSTLKPKNQLHENVFEFED